MEYNLEKINKIKERINSISSDNTPPIILLYRDDSGDIESISLTNAALNIDDERTYEQEIFYICSNATYENLHYVKLKDSYYICESLADLEIIASSLVKYHLSRHQD